MIKAYLAAIPSLYEGEDIEVRYSVFQEEELFKRESDFLAYVKPALAGLTAVLTLLRKLEKYKEQEITVYINDASLLELLKGTSTVKNGEVVKMAGKVKKQLNKFEQIVFVNVGKNKEQLDAWNENTKR